MIRLISTLIFVLVVAALAIGLRYRVAPPADAGDVLSPVSYVPVKTVPIKMEEAYTLKRRYTGEIVPLRTSDLGFEREGYLQSVLLREGAKVDKGEAIATLDTRRLEEQLRELEAAEREAQAMLDELIAGPRSQELRAALEEVNGLTAQLKYAKSTRERKESLFEKNAGTVDALESSRARERQLASELAGAKERLDELNEGSRREKIQAQTARSDQLAAQKNLLQIELDDSVLRAPYAGRIAERFLHEGTVIQKGDPVVRLLEDGKLTVRIGVPLDAAATLQQGSSVIVEVDGRPYQGTVASRLPALSETTRTATVIVDLSDDAASDLLVGQVVHLDIVQTVHETGCWLPTNALVRGTRGLWACLSVSETRAMPDTLATIGLLQKQDVEILHAGESKVFVRGTPRAGDRIVADGTHRVVQGQWVELLEE